QGKAITQRFDAEARDASNELGALGPAGRHERIDTHKVVCPARDRAIDLHVEALAGDSRRIEARGKTQDVFIDVRIKRLDFGAAACTLKADVATRAITEDIVRIKTGEATVLRQRAQISRNIMLHRVALPVELFVNVGVEHAKPAVADSGLAENKICHLV